MATYRCILLDSAQRLGAEEQFECEHDVDALIRAISMIEDQTRCQFSEIWCGARLIARLPKQAATIRPLSFAVCSDVGVPCGLSILPTVSSA